MLFSTFLWEYLGYGVLFLTGFENEGKVCPLIHKFSWSVVDYFIIYVNGVLSIYNIASCF